MVTTELKQAVINAMQEARPNFKGTDTQWATRLGINASVYNRMKKGEMDKLLADEKWISLARVLDVPMGSDITWRKADTDVFLGVWAQLDFCRKNGALAVLCDEAGVGKTYTAQLFAKQNQNVVYVDCSQVKQRPQLIRFMAQQLGLDNTGRYGDVYGNLTYYLRTLDHPLIILDEAGDLSYGAFLELKGLQNQTSDCCGWYMMGAEGLRMKMENGIKYRKVGYTEIFDRFGGRFQRISPEGRQEREAFNFKQAADVIKANLPAGGNERDILLRSEGRLRRVKIEIKKILN